MEECLKFKRLIALVLHMHANLKTTFAQRDTIYQSKLVWPLLRRRIFKHATTQAEIEYETVIGLVAQTFAAAAV